MINVNNMNVNSVNCARLKLFFVFRKPCLLSQKDYYICTYYTKLFWGRSLQWATSYCYGIFPIFGGCLYNITNLILFTLEFFHDELFEWIY